MGTPLSTKLDWSLANTQWAQSLNPIIANPLLQGKLIQNYILIVGNNIINHGLNRLQIGWFIVDQNAVSSIYRSASFNSQTLTLNSSGAVTVSLWCF